MNEINIGYLRSLRWWFKKSNHWCVRSPDGTLLGRRICCEDCDGIGLESSERTNRHPTRISTAYGIERHQGIYTNTGIPLNKYPALAGWDWAGIVALPCWTVLGDKFCPSFLCNIVTAEENKKSPLTVPWCTSTHTDPVSNWPSHDHFFSGPNESSVNSLFDDLVNTITRVRFLDVNSNLCLDLIPFRQGK